ncbi:hypothetical protein COCSADRAFT_353631 [Bipolaris sorokiniana ND90Pr]|uniref:DUF1996 domain-containing protein n=1 Tax=Cochliobolus sativus (strain ND90Pr / ATCC 201652) TaxID=665912 RepID=M2RI24_COCSN|nr:uncharacterized protein COCSADRAFT_353631 [Bipolaris sorokiniana ND90Pr]EMD66404.1 hypothetical protein COCSADRAFT_353631 [Bipolaris sorokiniana ND90Pr]
MKKTKNTKSMKSTIGHHDDKLRKLQEEYDKLEETRDQGMFTEEDEAKLKEIKTEMGKYASATAQISINHTTGAGSGSTEPMDGEPIETDTESGNTDHMTHGKVIANEPIATQPDAAIHALDPEKRYASHQEGSSGHSKMKQELKEESKTFTQELVDNLNMTWNIDVNDSHGESSLQHLPKGVFGHIQRSSRTRYCVRFGSKEGLSARFESILPNGSDYKEERDVTQGSNRIVEKIVQHHRDEKTALPMNILSQVRILLVYWDSKMGVGHDAEVEVLAPDFKGKRPHTRCFVYLNPDLYAQYNLKNTSGFSHETRSTMKLLMEGIDDRQKSIAIYNIAVKIENQFEKRWMSNIPGRPTPLCELKHETKAVSRRTKSLFATTEHSVTPTLMELPVPQRQFTPLPKTELEKTSVEKTPGMSLKQQFHKDFLELFELPEDITYYFLFGDRITAFPPGFRMIAGNASKQNDFIPPSDIPQSLWGPEEKTPKALAGKAIGFNCLNYSGAAEGSLTRHLLPNKSFIDSNCADGLRLELMFPSCWDGISLDANDHESHVAYPDLVMEGTCPADYQTRVPALFFETIWDTSVFRNVSGRFLLSNGDLAGMKKCLRIKL